MRLLFFLLFFVTSFQIELWAQLYDSAVGLRLGVPSSISYKKIFNDNKAIESYIGTRGKDNYRFTNLSGAYQIIQPLELFDLEELYYYYGFGASIYFWSFENEGPNQSVTPGIQGYLGVEYTFENKPINLTLDWRPTIFFSSNISAFKPYLAVGVRFVLIRDGSGDLDKE